MMNPSQQLRLWLDIHPEAPYMNIPRFELESVLIRLAELEKGSWEPCPHCDAAIYMLSADEYMQQFERADMAESALLDARNMVESILAILAPRKNYR